jgi:hypothetical protein
MSYEYKYDIGTYFPNGMDTSIFAQNITANTNITPTLDRIDFVDDDVAVYFNTALSSNEQKEMTDVVIPLTNSDILVVQNESICTKVAEATGNITISTANVWTPIFSNIYRGSLVLNVQLSYFIFYAAMSGDTTSFSIRIVNLEDNSVMGTTTSTNTNINAIQTSAYDIFTTSPLRKTKFEVQVRKDDGTTGNVNLKNVAVFGIL